MIFKDVNEINQFCECDILIFCVTYNHEKFVKYALDGFLFQKFKGKYHIFIHDDASQDKTQEIIRKYESKFPELITAILRTENSLSKNINYCYECIYPQMLKFNAKYVAFCDGDDYWCDDRKLQLQYDLLEKNDNINLCTHDNAIIDQDNYIVQSRKKIFDNYCEFNLAYMLFDQSRYFQTSSFLVRKSVLVNLDKRLIYEAVMDRAIVLSSTFNYKRIAFIPRIMSCYRVGYKHGLEKYNLAYNSNDNLIKRSTNFINLYDYFLKRANNKFKFTISAYKGQYCLKILKFGLVNVSDYKYIFLYLIKYFMLLPKKIFYKFFYFAEHKYYNHIKILAKAPIIEIK